MIKIIKFEDDFNTLSTLQKTKYIKELLIKEDLKYVINSLIYYNDDSLECFVIMNNISKKKSFKKKYKILNIELISMMIKSLVEQNKTFELEEYLNQIDEIKLEKIINYEIKNNTSFSKMKICKKIYNNFNKKNRPEQDLEVTKKIFRIDDKISDIKEPENNNIKKEKKNSNKKKILKKEIKNKKVKFSLGFILGIASLIVCYILIGYLYSIIFYYNEHVYPNIYLNDKLITGESHESFIKSLEEYENKLNNFIKLSNINDNYTYSYKDIGIEVNTDLLKQEIITSYENLNGFKKIKRIFLGDKLDYKVIYSINKDKYSSFLDELKEKVNLSKKEEEFRIINSSIYYRKGVNGFSLDTSNLEELLIDAITNDKEEILLVGNIESVSNPLGVINKKVSTFTTYYNEAQARSKNIRNAVSKLNGTIVNPGDIFSFYKAVGPYGGKGYVYYAGNIGSGVCQVSTTIYNAQLLLNLPTVTRYNHGDMVPYAEYGLDATVYKNTVDYKFKNNTKYPIYIEAIANNGALTISFWSNENIIEKGYSYKPRSVKISHLGYKTYLDTYYNGVLKESKYLDSSYYFKGK